MRIGVLGCGYSCENKLDERLNSWFNLAKEFNLVFSFVSVPFKEYIELNIYQDNIYTLKKLIEYKDKGFIQHIYISNTPQTEAEARNEALEPLLEDRCDFIWLLDLADEYYTEENIRNIIEYINKGGNDFYNWFSIPFRNYIFSGKEYILGFCPPRIFRVNPVGDLIYKLSSFRWDNDIIYKDPNGLIKDYINLASKKIPEKLLDNGIKHMTWLHSNGKQKYEYQMKHFGHCGYKWNYETNQLEFNLDYYKQNNLPIPEIHYDN